MRVLIIEDETAASENLIAMLQEIDSEIEVLQVLESVQQTVRWLSSHPAPDLIFMDIHLSDGSAFTLFQEMEVTAPIVFTTAYDQYALDAFKVNAIDYLVKPVETDRLAQAIARVREHVALHAKAQKSERIPVEKGGKKILIGIDKIRFVMARDDYAYLQTDTDRYFSTVSLAQLEKRLDGHGFFRVHRGYLVNLSMVEEVESVSGGTLLLTLNGVEEKIPVSRRRVSALKKALGL